MAQQAKKSWAQLKVGLLAILALSILAVLIFLMTSSFSGVGLGGPEFGQPARARAPPISATRATFFIVLVMTVSVQLTGCWCVCTDKIVHDYSCISCIVRLEHDGHICAKAKRGRLCRNRVSYRGDAGSFEHTRKLNT